MVQKQRSAQSASLIRSSTDQISAVAKLSQSKANDSDNDSRINPQAALLAAIRQRKGPNAARDEVDVVPSEEIASAKPNRLNPHSALLESIRDAKTSVSSGSLAKAAQLSTDKPPRAALLTSIKNATRSKVERNTTNSLSESDKQPIAPYDADKNPFLKSIGTKLSEIQAVYDDIDLKVESMITAWEATARYFGEASTTSSDHVFLLLNRLILDMRTTQLKRHRQRIHHSTFPASLGTFSLTVMCALSESFSYRRSWTSDCDKIRCWSSVDHTPLETQDRSSLSLEPRMFLAAECTAWNWRSCLVQNVWYWIHPRNALFKRILLCSSSFRLWIHSDQ